MKSISYLGLLFFLYTKLAIAQTQTAGFEIPNYASKSPEAAAFLKYGEYPVNLSTGVPNISIPLYTIEAKGLKIPISLDYHASGIKVSQEASWVGLGWNLNYGAQIVLNVVDEVDEGNAMIDQIPSDASIHYYDTHPYEFDQGPQVTEQFDKSRVKDIYSFSSPTANGQFYIRNKEMGDIVVYPPEAFKVEFISGFWDGIPGSSGFKIVDTKGNEYIFGTKEQSTQLTGNPNLPINYTSAWYVSEIRTATTDTIQFIYENDGAIVERSKSQKIDVKRSIASCGCVGSTTSNTIGTVQTQISNSSTYSKKIKEIIFDEGNSKIVFDRQAGRLDLVNGNSSLQQIRIMHRNQDSNSFDLIKGYGFIYSYFNQNATGTDVYLKKRLRLDKIETLLEGDEHTFVYSDLEMPSKDSNSQDAFGYFNNSNNSNLIPSTVINSPYNVTIGSANRTVNPATNQTGILKEISYPSKGKTKFIYETNQYWGQDILEFVHNVDCNIDGTGPGNSNPPIVNEDGCVNPPNCVVYKQCFFSASSSKAITAQITVSNNVNDNDTEIKYQYVRFKIIMNGIVVHDSGKKNVNQSITQYFTIPAGQGYVLAEAWGEHMHGWIHFSFNDSDSTTGNRFGPGLRISSVENYDHNNILVSKKFYEYNMPDNPSKTSGKWINDPYTGYWSRTVKDFGSLQSCSSAVGQSSVNYTMINTLSSNSVGLGQNSVTYEYVTEKDVNITDQSTVGYRFTNFYGSRILY